jgi:hypothetical protein
MSLNDNRIRLRDSISTALEPHIAGTRGDAVLAGEGLLSDGDKPLGGF